MLRTTYHLQRGLAPWPVCGGVNAAARALFSNGAATSTSAAMNASLLCCGAGAAVAATRRAASTAPDSDGSSSGATTGDALTTGPRGGAAGDAVSTAVADLAAGRVEKQRSGVSQGAIRGKLGTVTKSTATLVTERRESKLYTMQQYMELEEARKRRGAGEILVDSMEHPGWNLVALAIMSIGIVGTVVSMRLRRERFRFDPKMREVKSIDIDGGVSIGGPFSLVDADGKRWTNEDFKGKWLWIYFGFTNCPDVCPQEMAKMTRCITQVDKRVGPDYWQPLFISIDAKRDTPAAVQEYLKAFHPRIKGLTGTAAEVEAAAREFRVYFAVPDEFDETMPDYLIDHSIIMYLMDPDGKFSDYTTKEFTWYESHAKLLRRMTDYEKKRSATSADANLRVANLDSYTDDTDAAIGKTTRAPTVAEMEREKRATTVDPYQVSASIFDSWAKQTTTADDAAANPVAAAEPAASKS